MSIGKGRLFTDDGRPVIDAGRIMSNSVVRDTVFSNEQMYAAAAAAVVVVVVVVVVKSRILIS